MTIDGAVVPGLLFLLAEFAALAGVGYVIVRAALRETDDRIALAQGLVVGPAIWGVVVNFTMYALPGLTGAVAGWIFMLALAAVLVWRAAKPVRPRLRVAAGFVIAALAVFAVALASRQTLGEPAPWVYIGLAASIREGGFPPEFPWNPGTPAPYHYGTLLLSGLLAPPSGPDLAFVQELLGAYAWICLFLVVATALLRRVSGFAVLAAVPLLFATGMWTLVVDESPASVLDALVPTGIPAAGIRASLMDIYWPSVELPYASPHASKFSALPNIYNPTFILSYALAFVVLARAAHAGRRSWLSVITLAALIGFLGLTSTSLAPIAFVLWTGLEAVWLIQSQRAGSLQRSDVVRSVSGLALAGILLIAGSLSAFILGGSAPSGISLGTSEYFGGWRLLGTLDRLPGGVGILGLGPLAVAVVAVLLDWRNRLVQVLAAGTGALLLASLLLTYEPAPFDLVRLEGHARNFALFALLIALSVRFASLPSARWRYAAGAVLVGLIVWPTIAAPVRTLGLAVGNGVELANAQRAPGQRYVLEHVPSDRIAAYIRSNTAVDARVFSPYSHQMTFNTGRPNASGLVGLVHLKREYGPAYRDVLGYLEPAAVRRLGFEYVHAPDEWVESLPDEAVQRLNDPRLFELLVRDTSESLYRVLPAFLTLDAPPAPGSYEVLRQGVPESATVFVPDLFEPRRSLRTARALSHARLLGVIDGGLIHLRTPWRAEPLGDHMPDLIITPVRFVPWMFPPASRQPIWWNDETAVYALDGTVAPIMPPPPQAESFPFSVTLSDVRAADGRIAFTATFDDRAPDQWTGQDWIMIATQAPPWDMPTQLLPDGTHSVVIWFIGQVGPGSGMTSIAYELDFRTPGLAIRDENGVLKPLERSDAVLDSGSYVLAVRLRHEYKPRYWRDTAIIPVLRITVSETGEVSYQVHEDAGGEPAP